MNKKNYKKKYKELKKAGFIAESFTGLSYEEFFEKYKPHLVRVTLDKLGGKF